MGLVLELLPKVVVDNKNIFGQVDYYGNGTSELNYLNLNKASNNQNQNSNVPLPLQANLDAASRRVAQLKNRIAENEKSKAFLELKRTIMLQKLASDNTVAISEAIAISGKCGDAVYDPIEGRFKVTIEKGGAKGCSNPGTNPIGRKREVDYAINYANQVLPNQIKELEKTIKNDYNSLAKAEDELKAAQKAIDDYLNTQAEYKLKEAEAKNYPEAQRIKAEREAKLRELEIQARQRQQEFQMQAQLQARKMENKSKNIRIGLLVLGGLAVTGGLIYYFSTKK